eukprot:9992634-Ditylum_brightwellii.AAC.1
MVDKEFCMAVMDTTDWLPPVQKVWWTPEIGTNFRILQYWKAKLLINYPKGQMYFRETKRGTHKHN